MKLEPISKIKLQLGINSDGDVQKFFTNTCYNHMDKYVPKDTGMLRENATLTSNTITYEQEYAHVQYIGERYGIPFKNYTTPGTGPYWDKRMVSAEMPDIVKEVQSYINRR